MSNLIQILKSALFIYVSPCSLEVFLALGTFLRQIQILDISLVGVIYKPTNAIFESDLDSGLLAHILLHYLTGDFNTSLDSNISQSIYLKSVFHASVL